MGQTLGAWPMRDYMETTQPTFSPFADLRPINSCFTGQPIDYRLPCTARNDHTCQIASHLSAWNEVFSYAAFDIRFEPGTSGQLCLVGLPACHPPPGGDNCIHGNSPDVRQTSALLHRLLRTHHCVSAITITSPFLTNIGVQLLSKGIVASQSLRKLQLHVREPTPLNELCAAISALDRLEELELDLFECPADLPLHLSALLSTTMSLKALRMADVPQVPVLGAEYICRALAANNTLRELSLHGSCIRKACRKAFRDFLRSSATLTTLSVTAWKRYSPCILNCVLRGVLENTTVTSLTLENFNFDDESAKLAAEVLSADRGLRVFRMAADWDIRPGIPQAIFDRWLVSIKENEAFEELLLPFSIWTPGKWVEFFAAISRAPRLGKVSFCSHVEHKLLQFICNEEEDRELVRICRALEESGAADKVKLGSWHFRSSLDALECRAFSEVALDCSDLLGSLVVLHRLPSLGHITSVVMPFKAFYTKLSSALAKYVGSTTSLRSLELTVNTGGEYSADRSAGWTVVLDSLSRNTSLKELSITFVGDVDDRHMEDLAGVVTLSRNIRKVFISGSTWVFVGKLSEMGVVDNYTLLDVALNDEDMSDPFSWFIVSDTTRRNCDLVARAALCANGSRSSR
ncbi:hypothetical protein HPB49_006601 [Dermacentor silvarum]|uniref:Uncharacterized protein n=1 Tax=Dermacentor silvarum TaxID=543639 RepID=A0ACB8DVV0_DERSI|nr:hypothetical protein HPB49_006601 [Dermacentor silvarum]